MRKLALEFSFHCSESRAWWLEDVFFLLEMNQWTDQTTGRLSPTLEAQLLRDHGPPDSPLGARLMLWMKVWLKQNQSALVEW